MISHFNLPVNILSMKRLLIVWLILLVGVFGCSMKKEKLTAYVDPFIGTDAHGHVFPGATLPFGMVQLSPDTRKDSWDGCSGYHYSDSTILGFSHTHLSGTGVGDYGDVRLMPTTGDVQLYPGSEDKPETGYRSRFSHQSEMARPGYYQVFLKDYQITAELTVTPRVGFHRYHFPEGSQANVILDITEGITSDRIMELWIRVINDREVEGLRRTSGWARDQWVFFNAEFSQPFKNYGILKDGEIYYGNNFAQGTEIKAWFTFDTEVESQVMVKVGISAVSAEGARLNRQHELPHWDFDMTTKQAEQAWEKMLSKIRVEGRDKNRKKVFYTALYRTMIAPNVYSDVDGKYRGHDGKIHQAEGSEVYTVFSLWDTFRALHPLFTILHRKLTGDLINTMLLHYQQGGLLPVWELAANETWCMIGYHAVPVIVDAYNKGIRNFDTTLALEACLRSATQDHFGLDVYRQKGYIPADYEAESVSKTLEYAYDDWCIAIFAKALGRDDVYETFIQRAQFYKNIFDATTGFMRPKINDSWLEPFDPREVNFHYTEANAWQYSFFVPQDINGLMDLHGGADQFASRLEQMFNEKPETTGRRQADITGMIGQYAHGNEPSHHMAYLFNYAGKPWKTQEFVRKIMDELYTHNPDGLCGNEDCGQLSAWYVFSAMGFYPVTPGSELYILGTPAFDRVIITPENGQPFIIEAKNLSPKNFYVQSVTLDDEDYPRTFITHTDIMRGGRLTFYMGKYPNQSRGILPEHIPVSAISDYLITPVPYVSKGAKVFKQPQQIELACVDPSATIYFTTGSDPSHNFHVYRKPLWIETTTDLKAYASSTGRIQSLTITPSFLRIDQKRSIQLLTRYSPLYEAGGDEALIDHQRGKKDFRTGYWQGYQGVDLIAVIDLGEPRPLKKFSTTFIQDINSWIFMPEYVEYYISDNGENFTSIGIADNPIREDDWNVQTHDFVITTKPIKTRFVKVFAKNRGICPPWHKASGYKAWIFADEIILE